MPIETASMDKPLPARRIPSLELAVAMGIATLIAPAAAPASVVTVLLLLYGDFGGGLLAFALGPLALLTAAGVYGYVMAFFAVALLGTALTLLALRRPRLRPKWIWTAVGALFGMLIAAALVPSSRPCSCPARPRAGPAPSSIG